MFYDSDLACSCLLTTKSWHAKGYEYAAAATQLFKVSDILIYVIHEEQTGCVSSCQTVTMQDSSQRRKAAISSELKTFPYVAQRRTRTRLMSSFKDCLIGDASFSRCLANHGNCKLLELSSKAQESHFQPLRLKKAANSCRPITYATQSVYTPRPASHMRPASLYYEARGHICRLRMYYKSYIVLRWLGISLAVICPRAARDPALCLKRLETHAVHSYTAAYIKRYSIMANTPASY
jgi:hypothetical protein